MPFTLAHPAAVLPLAFLPRQYYSLTGLIVGSIAPDFEYFLRIRIQSDHSHTWSGLLYFDLPLGIVLAYIFHSLVKNRLIINLPEFLRARFIRFQNFNWHHHFTKNWGMVLLSIVFGAGSHILWDGFTHEHGHFVEILPILENSLHTSSGDIPVFKLLQHASSLLGLAIISLVIFSLKRSEAPKSDFRFVYWIMVTSICLMILAIRYAPSFKLIVDGNLVVTLLTGIMAGMILTPLVLRFTYIHQRYNGGS